MRDNQNEKAGTFPPSRPNSISNLVCVSTAAAPKSRQTRSPWIVRPSDPFHFQTLVPANSIIKKFIPRIQVA
ncbi:hypothetical protein N7468_007432 [Penicillium chermesinum]|uniref:Uncharacterized protein n=1 Tax=Penicillium chermesinum TaxID=63820 RepID=A0A9W9NUA5_9EURO|nr:uncharacterized protein N7468_007432 [Penicillium chermesinum]KAJ5226207.1 hypothetical protein N7468_007432 [Penicillium chermesinum]